MLRDNRLGLGESMAHLEWAADCGCNYRRETAGEDEDGDWMLESPDLTNELRGRPPEDLRAAKRDESINGRAKNLLRRFRCVSQCALTNLWKGGFTLQSPGTCHFMVQSSCLEIPGCDRAFRVVSKSRANRPLAESR